MSNPKPITWLDAIKTNLTSRRSLHTVSKPTLSTKQSLILSGPIEFDSECAAIACLKNAMKSTKDKQNFIVKVPCSNETKGRIYQLNSNSYGGYKKVITFQDEYSDSSPDEMVFNLFKGLPLIEVGNILFKDPKDVFAFCDIYDVNNSLSENIGHFFTIFGSCKDKESNRALTAMYRSNFFDLLASDKESAVDLDAIDRWCFTPYLEWPESENKYLQGVRYKYLVKILTKQFKRLKRPLRLIVLGIDRLDRETPLELEKLAQLPHVETLYSGRYPNHNMDPNVLAFTEKLFVDTESVQLMSLGQVISHSPLIAQNKEALASLLPYQAMTCSGARKYITQYSNDKFTCEQAIKEKSAMEAIYQ